MKTWLLAACLLAGSLLLAAPIWNTPGPTTFGDFWLGVMSALLSLGGIVAACKGVFDLYD